jgi:hypothetical protein
MKRLEVPITGVLLKPMQRLRRSIHSRLTMALGFLQIGEILPLDSFIFGAVFCGSSAQ